MLERRSFLAGLAGAPLAALAAPALARPIAPDAPADTTIEALHGRALAAWAGAVAWAKAGDFEDGSPAIAELNALGLALALFPATSERGIARKREIAGLECQIDARATMGGYLRLMLDGSARSRLLASADADQAALKRGRIDHA